uniref:Polynucleotide adenylyltransferase n=1 Tax=Pyrodinium bahamense TaxID=73915 RepID=A0A7S0BBM9_9DINO
MDHLLLRALGSGREIDRGLLEWLCELDSERDRWLREACRIEQVAESVCQRLGLRGSLQLFGSAVTGFGSSTSDVDLVFLAADGPGKPEPVQALLRLQAYLRDTDACYNLTTIFQPRAPLLKLTDPCGIEVDLVVNNYLGVRNTQLLRAYHDFGPQDGPTGRIRTDIVVRSVKEWARCCGLVGTIDGLINSYAWTLMAIYYLQVVEVLPNLQLLAEARGIQSWLVDGHETRFAVPSLGELEPAPGSPVADATAGALLYGFFQFYAFEFDWRSFAICVRLARPAPTFVRKSILPYGDRVPWYIEDPFDTRMNLARGTTASGRERIQGAIRAAAHQLQSRPAWPALCPPGFDRPFTQLFLKCRLQDPTSREAVPSAIWSLFGPHPPLRLYMRLDEPQVVEVYAQFRTWQDLRSAQSANERRIPCSEQPVALYISLGYGLFDELDRFVAYTPGMEREPASAYRSALADVFRPLPFGPPPPTQPQAQNPPVQLPTTRFGPVPVARGPEPPLPHPDASAAPQRTMMNPMAATFVPSGNAFFHGAVAVGPCGAPGPAPCAATAAAAGPGQPPLPAALPQVAFGTGATGGCGEPGPGHTAGGCSAGLPEAGGCHGGPETTPYAGGGQQPALHGGCRGATAAASNGARSAVDSFGPPQPPATWLASSRVLLPPHNSGCSGCGNDFTASDVVEL